MPSDPLAQVVPPLEVGQRVVLRMRLPDGSATDLIGWLLRMDDRVAVLDPGRHDPAVTADRSAVLALRRVPSAPGGPGPGRTSAAELERIAAETWVAEAEPLGEWLLRAGEGFTARANSCLAVGDPGLPAQSAAHAVEVYAHGHGIPARAQVVVGSTEEATLRGLCWVPAGSDTDVLVTRLADLLRESAPPATVQVAERLDPDWVAAYRRSRSGTVSDSTLSRILAGRPPTGLAAVRGPEGLVVAIGRGAVRQGWCGVASLWTEPGHRGRSHAGDVLAALGHWGARAGARNLFLQVAADNSAAQRVYARLGFTRHHSYRYLVPPERSEVSALHAAAEGEGATETAVEHQVEQD